MKNTIVETLKGLELALAERVQKAEELGAKDNSVLVEEKRAELQKEMDEKLDAFIAEIESEKENALAKINRDIETINELKDEYAGKLAEIEKEEAEAVVEEAENEKEEVVDGDAVVEETETVAEETPDVLPVFANPVVNHPFRP